MRTAPRVGLFLLLGLLQTPGANGAVRVAASCSYSDVQTVYLTCASGDTLVLPSGSATWTTAFRVAKGITIQGAGTNKTFISIASDWEAFSLECPTAGVARITGLTIQAASSGRGAGIFLIGAPSDWKAKYRIDHCQFVGLNNGIWAESFGLVDHCRFINCNMVARNFGNLGSGGVGAWNWAHFNPTPFDSIYYMFYEDNEIQRTNADTLFDSYESGSYVVRFCVIDVNGGETYPAMDAHGNDSLRAGTDAQGVISVQVYGNTIRYTGGATGYLHDFRGGALLVYSNTVTGGLDPGKLREEDCGWGEPPRQTVNNSYFWANKFNGVVKAPWVEAGSEPAIKLGQQFWTNVPSPFLAPPYPHPFIALTEGATSPVLTLSPSALSITAGVGDSATVPPQVSAINGGSTGVLTWVQSDNASWLQVTPASGTTPGTLTVSANPAGLSAGTYTGTVTVVSASASNSPQSVRVILALTAPALGLSPGSLAFSASPGGAAPAPQAVTVVNGGTTGVLSWTQSDNAAWLQVSPASGTTPGALRVSVDPTGLAVGSYAATVTVNAPGAVNTPQSLGVSLVIATGPQRIGSYAMVYPDRASFLAAGWDFLARTSTGATRNTEQGAGAVVSYDQALHPGSLRIPADTGDLWENFYNDTRNSCFRDLPDGWTSVRLKLKSFAPTRSSQQAGLVLYQDDDNYVQVYRIYEGGQYIGFIRETGQNASAQQFTQCAATTNVFLRMDRSLDSQMIEGYYSLNGTDWTLLGRVTESLTSPRLGIVVGASPGGYPNADVEWAEVYGIPPVADAPPQSPSDLRVLP